MKEIYTAIIPVRAGSKRIKDKNIQPFADSNLLIHKIRQLKKVKEIDNIVVSSDSEIMLQMAKLEGVNIHKRELKYADEKSTTFNEVVINIVSNLKGNHIMWVPCVCPLIDEHILEDVIITYKNYVINSNKYDSILTAKLIKEYIWDSEKPLNYSLTNHIISQNLPNWYVVVNGAYIAKKETMLSIKHVIGNTPYIYEVDKRSSIDIDDEYDLEIARLLYKNRTEQNRTEQNRTEHIIMVLYSMIICVYYRQLLL